MLYSVIDPNLGRIMSSLLDDVITNWVGFAGLFSSFQTPLIELYGGRCHFNLSPNETFLGHERSKPRNSACAGKL